MKSKIFSSSMIKENLKQQAWILGLAVLAFMLLYPVMLMTQFDQWSSYGYSYEVIQRGYETFLSIQGFGTTAFIVITVLAVLCAAVNFEYLHSPRKLDCYHSLPVRRSQLYWQRIWSSLLIFLISYVLAMFLAVCVGATHGYFSFALLKIVLNSFAVHGIYFLLVYNFCVLAMMLTGRILVGILGTGVLLVYVPAVFQVFRGYASIFFETYAGAATEPSSVLYYIDHYGSPISWGLTMLQKYAAGDSMIWALVGGIAGGILLLFLNLWIYKKRSTEAAGRSMAFAKVGQIIQFLMEIPAVLAIGIIGHDMVSEHSAIWWIVSMVLGIVVIHGVIEVIYQADFRRFFAHLPYMGVSAAIVAVICLIYQTDVIGYDRYLPAQDQLVSLDVKGESVTGVSQTYLTKSKGNTTFQEGYTEGDKNYLTLEPDSDFYSLLQDVIKEGVPDENEPSTTFVSVRYTLANGKRAYRTYTVDLKRLNEASQSIVTAENFKEVFYSQLEEKSSHVSDLSYENGNYYTLYYDANRVQSGDQNEILNLLAQDVADADTSVFKEEPVGMLNVSYRGGYENGLILDQIAYSNEGLLIYPGFKRTCAFLEQEGIQPANELNPSDVESIRVYTWNEQDGQLEDLAEYTDSQEIEEILPSLRLTGTWTAWSDVRDQQHSVEVLMKNVTANGESEQFGYSILAEKSRELLGE